MPFTEQKERKISTPGKTDGVPDTAIDEVCGSVHEVHPERFLYLDDRDFSILRVGGLDPNNSL